MTNRFNGLDLIDRVPEELWAKVHNIVQEAVIKTIPKKKKCKKAKWLSEEAWENEMATHSSILAWRIPETEEPSGLRVWGRTESDTTEVI